MSKSRLFIILAKLLSEEHLFVFILFLQEWLSLTGETVDTISFVVPCIAKLKRYCHSAATLHDKVFVNCLTYIVCTIDIRDCFCCFVFATIRPIAQQLYVMMNRIYHRRKQLISSTNVKLCKTRWL